MVVVTISTAGGAAAARRWCGHCKALTPAYTQAAERLAGIVPFIAVDCDAEANRALCGQHGVQVNGEGWGGGECEGRDDAGSRACAGQPVGRCVRSMMCWSAQLGGSCWAGSIGIMGFEQRLSKQHALINRPVLLSCHPCAPFDPAPSYGRSL